MTTAKAPAKKTTAKRAPAKKAAPPAAPAGLDEFKPSPDPRLDVDVPADLQFTSTTGRQRDPEKFAVTIDGNVHYVYQPSDALLVLVGANLSSGEASPADKVKTLLNLVNQCVDSAGVQAIRARMFDARNDFDDQLLGNIAAAIFDRWAPEAVDRDAITGPGPNRAARRQNAR
ncbi:MAG: hypothetical protein WAZ19_11245 [Anaerolineae bacterium]